MKRKILVLVLVLAVLVSAIGSIGVLTGFQLADDTINGEAIVSGQANYMYPNKPYEVTIETGAELKLSGPYRCPITVVYVDGVATTNFTYSAYAGYFSLGITGLDDGLHTIAFSNGTYFNVDDCYSAVVTVGTPSITTLSNAVVMFMSNGDNTSNNFISQYSATIGSVLANLPTPSTIAHKEFVNWSYWDNSQGKYITFTSTNLPTITAPMLVNGVLRVVANYQSLDIYTINYFQEAKGFLGIKKWELVSSEEVEDGKSIVTNGFYTFGDSFSKYSTDKAGTKEVQNGYKPTKDMNLYVQMKSTDKVKVTYVTKTLGAYGTGFNLVVFRTQEYISGGTVTLLTSSEVPAFDDKAFSYWSTDKKGVHEYTAEDEITGNLKLYAQYDKEAPDNVTKAGIGALYEKVNGWWNTGSNIIDYAISTVFLLLAAAVVVGLVIGLFKLVIKFFSGSFRR